MFAKSKQHITTRASTSTQEQICAPAPANVWGAVRKNIISDGFSTKTAIAVFVLNLSDIIFLRTASHTDALAFVETPGPGVGLCTLCKLSLTP